MKHLKVLLVILLLVVAFVIAVQNSENLKTPLDFKLDLIFVRYVTPPLSLASVTVIAFLTGAVFMGSYGIVERFRMKRRIRTLRDELRKRDKELDSLKNLPMPMPVEGALSEQGTDIK